MADIDPWLMQQVLDISKRQRETDVEHHFQADYVGTGFEVAKWGVFCHPTRLRNRPAPLKHHRSDNARGSEGG